MGFSNWATYHIKSFKRAGSFLGQSPHLIVWVSVGPSSGCATARSSKPTGRVFGLHRLGPVSSPLDAPRPAERGPRPGLMGYLLGTSRSADPGAFNFQKGVF